MSQVIKDEWIRQLQADMAHAAALRKDLRPDFTDQRNEQVSVLAQRLAMQFGYTTIECYEVLLRMGEAQGARFVEQTSMGHHGTLELLPAMREELRDGD